MKVSLREQHGDSFIRIVSPTEFTPDWTGEVDATKLLRWRKATAAYEAVQKEMQETVNGDGK